MASFSTARQNLTQPENAFDGVAPYYAPKSTEPWDLFINHRGCDVKHTLAATICHTLQSMGLHVFLDVEALDAGDCIPAEIQHAIDSATLHIAIFSPNYAQSPWCLAELSSMLKTGKKIIPIFYHVEPSDLRRTEKGKYATAFSDHKQKGRYKSEKLDEWKGALRDSSILSGYLVNNNEDEATVLKKIVNHATEMMKKKRPLWVAERPVGLDDLVQGFESVAGEEEAKITGIVGLGGCGKTTLAKELFNRNFSSFERHSFVFDVRDAASRNALPDKQKKLLKDLGADHLSSFDHLDEGKAILDYYLSSRPALIVLDDVDHIDQLNALLPVKDNLAVQSMIIVTTRELGVLISWGLSCIYRMGGLNTSHAEQLFCWHAFLRPSPPAEFEILVQDFLKACNGLPLSLKVLGAHLYGRKSKDYWKSLLHKILRILPGEIKRRLQVSYDALDEEDREMFLDVACFLIGEEKHRAIAVWDGSGWSGLRGFETLENKCLVELDVQEVYDDIWQQFRVKNIIRMHDQLRDIGREIASGHSPYRLWSPEQIDNMKKHSTEIKLIRGIQPADAFVAFKEYTHQLMRNSSRQSKRLRLSNGLQILSVKGNEFTEEFAALSEDLVWLRWEDFPLRNIPSWLKLTNLRVLELSKADKLEKLWRDNADPPLKLRELILPHSPKLQWLPSSIKHLQDLKRLVVDFDGSSLPDEFCGLQSLEYLRLSSRALYSLSNGFGNLTSLTNINLQNCKQLSVLPDSFDQLIHLESLDLSYCEMLSSLPAGFGNLSSLKEIHLRNCNQLSMLPDSFSQLIHLKFLNLSYCEMLSSLPDGFGNLTSLERIIGENCKQLSMLPDSFTQLIHLEGLNLSHCEMLSSLPDGFGNLTSLKRITLNYCKQLSVLPDSISQLIHLEYLRLFGCEMLSSLPDGLGNLTSLKDIDIRCCEQLSMLPDSFTQLIHWEYLSLDGCEMLSSLPDDFGNLTNMKSIYLFDCKQLSMLPDSFSQLIHLEELRLEGCEMLSSLPDDFGNLTSLKYLYLGNCKQLSMLPDSFSQLKHLKFLDLSGCAMLSSLPDGFDNLTSLENIKLENCKQLSMLPDSFSRLIHLKYLDLSYCEMLSSLPETLPASLITLTIIFCNLLKNIRCISGLRNLEVLEICDCVQIEELPSFADLASLNEFNMWNCPKVEKIEGLEHAKSLSKLCVRTCWRVPGIQSLEKVEGLGDLQLECDTISALKPCIQSIKGKECLFMMRIQGSVIRPVEPIVNCLKFPDLQTGNVDEILDDSDDEYLYYVEKNDEERKVVRLCYESGGFADEYFFDHDFPREKATVLKGKRQRVMGAFFQLLELLE